MLNYQGDVNEIIAFVSAAYGTKMEKSKSDASLHCLEQIASSTDDENLNNRALFFRNTYTHNANFMFALSRVEKECCSVAKCAFCPIAKYCNFYIVKRNTESLESNLPTVVDLFCGAGGLSLGFVQAGFKISLANDIEPCCIDTYSHNHPEVPRENIYLGDIDELLPNITARLRFTETDVVIGGPPCQGFSMANRQRLIDDPRNRLYKKFVEAVSLLNPKLFVMENVKGMLLIAPQIVEDFQRIGYVVKYRIINACHYGVPQNRERIIFFGTRLNIDLDEIFNDLVNLSVKTRRTILADALFGLKPLLASRIKNASDVDSDTSGRKIDSVYSSDENEYIQLINMNRRIRFVCNHKARYNNDRDIEIYSRLHQGDKSDDPKIADIMPYASRNHIFRDKYYKLEASKICKTITAHMKFDCNMYIHPYQARGLTPREAARIQSYPDDYFFRGAYTKTFMQIGNSVPPLLGRAIAKVIKNILEKESL